MARIGVGVMIRLIIKGTRADCETALKARNLWLNSQYDGRFLANEQTVFVPDSALNAVQLWFIDAPIDPPFPPGSLLYYRLDAEKVQ